MRLKNPRDRFTRMNVRNVVIRKLEPNVLAVNSLLRIKNLNGMAPRTARMRFDTGPANEVNAVPRTGFLKLYSFTGTGLLHPNRANIIIKAPTGSIWASGLRVILPLIFAVRSPSLYAV